MKQQTKPNWKKDFRTEFVIKSAFGTCINDLDGKAYQRIEQFIAKVRTQANEQEREKLRKIIDEEIKEIEKEQPNRLKLQEIYASGRIDGLYFIRKTLKKKIKLVEKLE